MASAKSKTGENQTRVVFFFEGGKKRIESCYHRLFIVVIRGYDPEELLCKSNDKYSVEFRISCESLPLRQLSAIHQPFMI